MKSALRDWLSVSNGKITILLTGSLRSPPPIRAAPDFPLCRGQNKAPQSNPFTQRIAKNKVPPPGGRWWRQPPKGVHSLARRAVVWFYNTGAFYKFRGAHHGLCPLSGANTTLGPEGRQARWMPYAPLRRRRRPLREYRKAPPRRLVFIER